MTRFVAERADSAQVQAMGYGWQVRDTETGRVVSHYARALDAYGAAQLFNVGRGGAVA